MFCVVYSSSAVEGTSEEDVFQIVEDAEKINSRNRVTGALVFDGERFCQLLEGEKGAVMSTLDRIIDDPRHDNLEIIGSTSITERRFPGWAMLRIDASEFSSVLDGLAG